MVQDLWQVRYQILLIILQKKFIKLHGMIVIAFWITKVPMTIQQIINV